MKSTKWELGQLQNDTTGPFGGELGMGIHYQGLRSLLYAKSRGVDFGRMATIGRQSLILDRALLQGEIERFGESIEPGVLDVIFGEGGGYAERLFEWLGATDVTSFDHSDYEGASELADMNRPITSEFAGLFDLVLDGGTLEHVFNVATAFENVMRMVRVGGTFVGITPANNFLGHGFYQFSPEFFSQLFVPENGFELRELIAIEDWQGGAWYHVRSPRDVGGRVTLINHRPVMLLVLARKVEDVDSLRHIPMQSDYEAIWYGHERGVRATTQPTGTVWQRVKARVPNAWKHSIKVMLRDRSVSVRSGFDPRFFQRFDPAARS